MMDIIKEKTLSHGGKYVLGLKLSTVYGWSFSNTGYDFSIFDPHDPVLAQAIADGADTLTVASDKESIASDNIEEATITCAELATVFDYNVYLGDDIVLSGNVGDGNLEFSTNVPGSYIIEIVEQGTYNTGYVNLEVT